MNSDDTVWRLAQLLNPGDVSADYSAYISNLQRFDYPTDNASEADWESSSCVSFLVVKKC